MYFISFVIGLILVIGSLFLIRRELTRAVNIQNAMLEQSKFYRKDDLFETLENLKLSIDEMNHAFYDIANDLEGKYSLHEKDIHDLKMRLHEPRLDLNIPEISTPSKDEELINRITYERSQGKTLMQIAKELDMGYGELQLLLQLKSK